jgi:hypothetical protein
MSPDSGQAYEVLQIGEAVGRRRAHVGTSGADHREVMDASPERVLLVIPRVGAVEAHVARAVPGAVELLFAAAPPASPRFLHRRTARVESLGEATEVVIGTILAVPAPSGRVREDAVHVLYAHVAPPADAPAGGDVIGAGLAPPAPPNRRAHDRISAERPVCVKMADRWIAATTRDVSAGGALLTGAQALIPGRLVEVRLELLPTDGIRATGSVTRSGPGGTRGLRLEQMAPQDRLFLRRWLATRAGLLAPARTPGA